MNSSSAGRGGARWRDSRNLLRRNMHFVAEMRSPKVNVDHPWDSATQSMFHRRARAPSASVLGSLLSVRVRLSHSPIAPLFQFCCILLFDLLRDRYSISFSVHISSPDSPPPRPKPKLDRARERHTSRRQKRRVGTESAREHEKYSSLHDEIRCPTPHGNVHVS